jgi:hypothetical protein
MVTEVADQADDVLGDEPSDGAAGVHADDDLAGWVEHESGRLQVHRVVVNEGAGGGCDGAGVGAVADGELQPRLAISSWVVASSSTDSATTNPPIRVRRSRDRWKARSWALQYGHHEPR